MVALRYVYVLALSLWFGGTILVGLVAAPVSDPVLQRFFLVSYVSGAALLVSLLAMASSPSDIDFTCGLNAALSSGTRSSSVRVVAVSWSNSGSIDSAIGMTWINVESKKLKVRSKKWNQRNRDAQSRTRLTSHFLLLTSYFQVSSLSL